MAFEIVTVDAPGGVTVLELKGDLDTTTAPRLEARIREVVAQPDPALVLDLSALAFVSSFGLRVIVLASKAMRAHGDRFALHSPQDDVRGILQLAGFTRFIKVTETRSDALAEVAA